MKQTTADLSGTYFLEIPIGTGYKIVVSKTGYLTETYEDIEITEDTTTYLETILQISEDYSGTGNIDGYVYSALDGRGVSGVTINFRKGINVTSGNIVTNTTTDYDGYYNVNDLVAGSYTGEITKSDYNTSYFTAVCLGGITNSGQNGTITPILAEGETRIVLTWDEYPFDLDSHLTGPILESSNRFHIYFYNKGSQYYSPYAFLDLDDTYSYGPETTTILQQFDGVYRFSVHDYSNSDLSSSTALSNSEAQIKIFRGSNLVATYNVPSNQEGTLWTVFELSGNTITPINTMEYVSYTNDIARNKDVSKNNKSHSDADLIKNIPSK